MPVSRHGDADSVPELSAHRVCAGRSNIGTGFYQSTSMFPCHYHSTIAPYTYLTRLTLTLFNINN